MVVHRQILCGKIEEGIRRERAQGALGRNIERSCGINQDQTSSLRSPCQRQKLLRRRGFRGGCQQNFISTLKQFAFEQSGQHFTPVRENNRGPMSVAGESFRGGYGSLRKALRANFAIRRRFRLVFAEHRRPDGSVRKRINENEASGSTVTLIRIEK